MKAIKQRLSEEEKREDDFALVKELFNTIIPSYRDLSVWLDGYEQDLQNYRLVNSQIDQSDFEEVCNPLGLPNIYYEDNFLPFNKIASKVNLLLGEELTRNASYSAVLLDSDSISEKDIEIERMYRQFVESKRDALLRRLDLESQGIPEEIIKQEEEKIVSEFTPEDIVSFQSEHEVLANAILRHANYAQELKKKKNLAFKHSLITGKEIVKIEIINGKPEIVIVNPLNFFSQRSVDKDEGFEKGDYAGEVYALSIEEAIRQYGDDMSQVDLDELNKFTTASNKKQILNDQMIYNEDKTFMDKYGLWEYQIIDRLIGQYGENLTRNHLNSKYVVVTKLTWKWQKKVGFLTEYDPFGETDVKVVPEDFKIPKGSQKRKEVNKFGKETTIYTWTEDVDFLNTSIPVIRELEWIWVPTVWEATRIGKDIWVNIREIPYQPVSVQNPYDVCLPYIGTIHSATNAESISPVSRMKPFQFLYFIVMNQFVKLIARNYGKVLKLDTTQIDVSGLGEGDPERATEITLAYLRQGVLLYNSMRDAESTAQINISRPAMETADYSNTTDLLNMANILSWLDQQIGMGFGISPEREAQFGSNTNVTDNRQAIIQSSTTTEYHFFHHNDVWKRVMTYYLNVFRLWAEDRLRYEDGEKFTLSYVLPDGASALLSITADSLKSAELGLFINNAGNANEYFDTMRDLALTFVQNDRADIKDISSIVKARLDGTSPEEVHKMMVKLQKRQDERQEAAQKSAQQAQQAQIQMEIQLEEKRLDNELQKIREKGEQDRLTEAVKQTQSIQ